DIFGHLPMLFAPEHREYLCRLATVMSKAAVNELDTELFVANRQMSELKSDPSASGAAVADAEAHVRRVHGDLREGASQLAQLGRIYLWTVEFGLIGKLDAFFV